MLIPLMVVAVLFFSLVESFFVLPAHLGHGSDKSWRLFARWDRFQEAVHQQCNAHLINRCNELLETATPAVARFPRAVKELLQRGRDVLKSSRN